MQHIFLIINRGDDGFQLIAHGKNEKNDTFPITLKVK